MKVRNLSYRLAPVLVVAAVLSVVYCAAVLAVARGYATDDTSLQSGMVVALSPDGTAEQPKVERATIESGDKAIGVTVNVDESLLTTGSSSQQVYVQTDGEAEAFVSDINGAPQKGDLLAVSPLRGILIKTGTNTGTVVGTALEDFDDGGATTQNVDKEGTNLSVKIDKIRINLDRKTSGQNGQETDSSLERLGRSIVGKEVGEIRVVVALIIFFIVLVAEGGIIYGAVSSAITSLGRNPLARKIIIREMVRVVLIAVVVLLFGLASIYAILWA